MTTPTATLTRTPPEATVPLVCEYIVKTPGTCGEQARIAGTRIKVKHVFTWVERMGLTPAQVVQEYPHLTMAQVHAALAYYWSHQEEIHKDIETEERLVAETKAKAGPSKLQARLSEIHGKDDSLPPG